MRTVTPGQMATILRGTPERLEKAMLQASRKSAAALVGHVVHEIRSNPPPLVDRGMLVASTKMFAEPRETIVAVTAPYAGPLEFGTRPFRPPLRPLVEWAKRKGAHNPEGLARAVQQSFMRHGMKPKGYFARAVRKWRASNKSISAEMKRAFERLARRNGGSLGDG